MGSWLSLRARERGRRPAGVRRPAGRPGRARTGRPRTGRTASCRPSTRASSSGAAARRSATCSPRRSRPAPPSARSPRASWTRSNAVHWSAAARRRSSAARIRSYELAARMQTGRAGGRGPRRRARADPRALRPGSRRDGRLRPPLPAGPAAAGTRRPVRAGLPGGPIAGSPRRAGTPTRTSRENHGAEALRDRPAGGRPDPRPEAARDARGHARDLHHRVRPHPVRPVGRGTSSGPGRDHNRYGFSCWLAGAGLKPGIAHGATDEIGWKAAVRTR